VDIINAVFDSYYLILAVALALLVPIWFGSFVYEAVATIIARRRR
jgi:hypothetical protein